MTLQDAFEIFASMLSARLPVLIVSAVGLYFSLSHKELAPRAFVSAAWGFSLLIVNALVGIAINVAMFRAQVAMQRGAPTDVLFWLSILRAVAALMYIAGIILLARAVFLDRASAVADPE